MEKLVMIPCMLNINLSFPNEWTGLNAVIIQDNYV